MDIAGNSHTSPVKIKRVIEKKTEEKDTISDQNLELLEIVNDNFNNSFPSSSNSYSSAEKLISFKYKSGSHRQVIQKL